MVFDVPIEVKAIFGTFKTLIPFGKHWKTILFGTGKNSVSSSWATICIGISKCVHSKSRRSVTTAPENNNTILELTNIHKIVGRDVILCTQKPQNKFVVCMAWKGQQSNHLLSTLTAFRIPQFHPSPSLPYYCNTKEVSFRWPFFNISDCVACTYAYQSVCPVQSVCSAPVRVCSVPV